MKNIKLQRIENSSLSDDVKSIAINYGFKTVGKFYQFVKQCNPNAKLYSGILTTRATRALRELNTYIG